MLNTLFMTQPHCLQVNISLPMLSFFLHTKIKQSNLLIEMQVTHGNYSDKPFLKDNIISS